MNYSCVKFKSGELCPIDDIIFCVIRLHSITTRRTRYNIHITYIKLGNIYF